MFPFQQCFMYLPPTDTVQIIILQFPDLLKEMAEGRDTGCWRRMAEGWEGCSAAEDLTWVRDISISALPQVIWATKVQLHKKGPSCILYLGHHYKQSQRLIFNPFHYFTFFFPLQFIQLVSGFPLWAWTLSWAPARQGTAAGAPFPHSIQSSWDRNRPAANYNTVVGKLAGGGDFQFWRVSGGCCWVGQEDGSRERKVRLKPEVPQEGRALTEAFQKTVRMLWGARMTWKGELLVSKWETVAQQT